MNFSILRKAFGFYLSADTRYQVHSPFVSTLIKEVVHNKRNYYALDKIDTLRDHLKRNNSEINHSDFGAGSQFNTKKKTVASFVNSSASDNYKGQVLYHLVRHFHPQTVLELGTNLGLGTAYLASANKSTEVNSLEGCPNLSQVARKVLNSVDIKNAKIVTGKFEDTLKKTCIETKQIDLAFIDGDHSYDASHTNYQTIKPFLHEKSIVVFDDIYWSDGMLKAWNEIKKDAVLSIDLFRLGILFFDADLKKGELKLIPCRYKPWKWILR